jgi:hypothetical protein
MVAEGRIYRKIAGPTTDRGKSGIKKAFMKAFRTAIKRHSRQTFSRDGKPYLTLDPNVRTLNSPVIVVSPDYFVRQFLQARGVIIDALTFHVCRRNSLGVLVRRSEPNETSTPQSNHRWKKFVLKDSAPARSGRQSQVALEPLESLIQELRKEFLEKHELILNRIKDVRERMRPLSAPTEYEIRQQRNNEDSGQIAARAIDTIQPSRPGRRTK